MNVVMIGPFAFRPKGTVSARAFLMARALVGRGHRVTILMPPFDHIADSGREWRQDGVHLANLTMRADDTWHRLVVPVGLARRAVRLEPDVIHVFKPIAYSGLAGLYLRCASRRPLVLDTDDWEGTGGWNDVNPYPAAWKRLFDWQERWLARHADAVTAVSRTLQAQVWGFGADPGRVFYLPNGPDPALRDRTDVSAAEVSAVRAHLGLGEAPFALYLGHIPHGSDLDLALVALTRIRDRLPQARLVIAGLGDGLPALRSKAQALGVADRTLFPGWIDHDQAHLYLAAANVTINPYRDTPINRAKCAGKVVAAMAMGKAVITTRLGENLSYIEHGRSGFLVAPGDVDGLAEALFALLSNPELAAELGRNAHRRIWEDFDWTVRAVEIERCYHVAIQRAQGDG